MLIGRCTRQFLRIESCCRKRERDASTSAKMFDKEHRKRMPETEDRVTPTGSNHDDKFPPCRFE